MSTSRTKSTSARESVGHRRRRAERRLLPASVGLWALSLVSFVLAFVLGNTGSATAMAVSFIGGMILAALASVGAFLTALSSVVTCKKHRPWNVVVLVGVVLISPATILLLVLEGRLL